MLRITINGSEYWNPLREEFVETKSATVNLEHSLLSISKWEAEWHRPFLHDGPKTPKEFISYVKCMCLDEDVDPNVFYGLSTKNVDTINEYLKNPMTATWFGKGSSYLDRSGSTNNMPKRSKDIITSEVIYYWLVALGIPFECEKWPLNRLLTLVRVCNEKNAPPKKMSKKQLMSRNTALNQLRRQQLNSTG